VDRRHHHEEISDFKTENSHWGSGHYCMLVRVVLVYEVIVTNSQMGNCGLLDWTAVPDLGEGTCGLLSGPCAHQGFRVRSQILVIVSLAQLKSLLLIFNKAFLISSNINRTSQLTEMILFVISADLSCPIFTD